MDGEPLALSLSTGMAASGATAAATRGASSFTAERGPAAVLVSASDEAARIGQKTKREEGDRRRGQRRERTMQQRTNGGGGDGEVK